jgi:hypothetical protein
MVTVKLIDGTEVDSASEAWRAECEARSILMMPSKAARIRFMEGEVDPASGRVITKGVLQHRGQAAYEKLKSDVMELWQKMRSQ